MKVILDCTEERDRVTGGESKSEVLADLIEALCEGQFSSFTDKDFMPCSRKTIKKAMR